jgi:hypothetical protein
MGSMRVWLTALCLSSILAAQTPALVENPPSETSFHLSAIEFSYPGTYRSLSQIDFRNLAVNFLENGLRPLKDGKYESQDKDVGFEAATFESVDFLPSTARTREQFALVLYTHTSGEGSTSNDGIAQVFALADGHLKIVQQMTWDEHFSPPGNWYMHLSNGVLTIRSARYLDGDAHCCIAGMDTVTLRWNGSRFAQTRMITERLRL